ncbi:MAG TPA: 2-succinyl-5-enolpyruvyl-6-hydroxy-3-cyclohexene-1-carboxylic-acid synthase [Acidimicrobiales bacterium]|nr:2-succinyl-5-enolpyruvyl-6-hydroxy-3-cyclohexene-1-carboxylic-acid synthase [Acidimicrobiales bacterium]
MPITAAATFCATLVDEWVRAGVTDAVVAPGSRSTPLAIALADRAELRLHVHHDERSASFLALGLGLATGRPAVLLCTSGTAAAHFHAAVIEAHQAEVPLVVCTADRPPELRDVSAPQTIDQDHLYGSAVRWFSDPGVPEEGMRATWRSLAARAVDDAAGPRPGPVHLNLPFRDPLVGEPGELPPGRPDGWPWHATTTGPARLAVAELDALGAVLDTQRGVIIAGAGAGDPRAVHRLASAAGWPVLADPRSGCRVPEPTTVAAFDTLLRHTGFAADHTPEVVLRLGQPPASKVLNQWLAGSGARQVQVAASPAWVDPEHSAAVRVVADPTASCTALEKRITGSTGTPWLARWQHAEARAQTAIDAVLAAHPEPTEPGVARALLATLAPGTTLMASSSMPIRDLEWYGAPRDGVRVLANRGANGIDGVVSTAVGAALGTGAPTALLIGDVALLHDSNGLLGLTGRDVDLTIVVVDNDGGGIFSFLPQATALPAERFEQLFGTPHGVDPAALAAVHGIPTCGWDGLGEVLKAGRGARLVRVRTDRAANVVVHDEINRAVMAALG